MIYCLLMFTTGLIVVQFLHYSSYIAQPIFFLPIMDLGSKSRLDLFIFRDVQELQLETSRIHAHLADC